MTPTALEIVNAFAHLVCFLLLFLGWRGRITVSTCFFLLLLAEVSRWVFVASAGFYTDAYNLFYWSVQGLHLGAITVLMVWVFLQLRARLDLTDIFIAGMFAVLLYVHTAGAATESWYTYVLAFLYHVQIWFLVVSHRHWTSDSPAFDKAGWHLFLGLNVQIVFYYLVYSLEISGLMGFGWVFALTPWISLVSFAVMLRGALPIHAQRSS